MTSGEDQCPLRSKGRDDLGQQATALAEQWLSRRGELQGKWHDWVAAQLYQTRPLALAKQARRELRYLAGSQRA